MTPFGVLLRYYREQRGLSQRSFSDRLGITNRALSSMETGKRRPPTDATIQRMGDILHLSAAELASLRQTTAVSTYTIRVSREVSPDRLVLAHQFVGGLATLGSDQIAAIRRMLDADEGKQSRSWPG